ncbi:MAG: hypothetical protein HY261_03760 [Chloroflexi bacterium]|nr:hypothetical protein [Chloroflexota bacterium]
MTYKVTDLRANQNENILHAAKSIGRSKDRRKVFEAVYRGKKQVKSVDDLRKATGLSPVRVLQEGKKLSATDLVEQVKDPNGRVAYKKYDTYSHYKKKVLDLVDHPDKKSKYPTKQEPRLSGATSIKISLGKSPQPQDVTVDDIEAFAKVKGISAPTSTLSLANVLESRIKEFLKRVIGESHDFPDWGGEKNDLYTNRLRFRGSRRKAAFALKGRATQGPLTPKKMGKNGDQIGRLVGSDAVMFSLSTTARLSSRSTSNCVPMRQAVPFRVSESTVASLMGMI